METTLINQKYVTFSVQNILILVMMLFFGFTSLRFGMYGLGELILLYFCIVQLAGQQTIQVSLKNHVFSVFWIFYLSFVTFGYVVNTLLSISPQYVSFDYKAYVVLLFLCFTFEQVFKRSDFVNLYSLLRFIYFWGLFIVGTLYFVYLLGIRSLLGFSLTYAGSNIFSPFANDYHQFAYFVAPLPFIGLYIITKEKSLLNKMIAFFGILLSINIGLATTSSTLVSAWGVATMCFCVLKASEFLRKQKSSFSINIALGCFLLFFLIIGYGKVILFVQNFFHGDTNGENRLIIWGNAIKAWLHSPIFGLGPGSYSGTFVFGGFEAHNTFLQILTQAGILGGILYILLVSKLLKTTRFNTYILCAVITLLMYGFGINDLRRTVLWFYYILFYFLTLKSKGEM
ncbi:O-antigen ligase family protein [Neobacillus cucumis]|uniref:O-antigen ligase-related domain-containing protein n=1 Tax=Neobacillus cucumis TaxID=1740721 RepID=A0A2N5H6H7_9BACI|nr:O-antigen ligase family protein [Neobacillus cucumis]PLS01122.1 hypothetical protein CVD27_27460 [Neobacillus cucumis]